MNTVKPRYDNGGSEFGIMHRDLPTRCGMFDIDRMSAVATMSLELKKQDEGFIEYRTNFTENKVDFIALFEVKHHDSPSVRKSLECRVGSATWAQLKMCEMLQCRYFFVIGTNGKQPFKFYEVFINGNSYCGELNYTEENRMEAVNRFWVDIGLL